MVKVETLKRCLTDRIDRRMGNVVNAVEDRIQNTFRTTPDNTIIPRIEKVVRSATLSGGQHAASFTAPSHQFLSNIVFTVLEAGLLALYRILSLFIALHTFLQFFRSFSLEVFPNRC